MPGRSLMLALVLYTLGGVAVAAAQVPKELRDAEKLAAEVEAAEMGQGDVGNPDKLAGRARKQLKAVDKYVGRTPGDARALVLQARLGRIVELTETQQLSGGPDGWTVAGGESLDLQGLLDRALALDSTLAAAHYWKARIHATSRLTLVDGAPRMTYDYERAVVHARRALELEPANAWYRETLAQYLAFTGALDEAAEVMREVDDGAHPLYRLIADLRALPVPAGALPDPAHVEGMAAMAAEGVARAGNDLPYARVRFASWLVRGSPADVERFYRERWLDFQTVASKKYDSWSAFLLSTADGLAPHPDPAARTGDILYPDGVYLSLNPVGDAATGALSEYASPSLKAVVARLPGEGPVTRIFVANGHGLDWLQDP